MCLFHENSFTVHIRCKGIGKRGAQSFSKYWIGEHANRNVPSEDCP